MLLINDIALRANGIEPFAWFAEIQLIFNQKCGTMKAKKSGGIVREDKLGDVSYDFCYLFTKNPCFGAGIFLLTTLILFFNESFNNFVEIS